MPFTIISKPSVGDPTKKTAFADAVIDDLNYLYNVLISAIGTKEILINGSFEVDVDADGYPDGWTRTLYNGGSFTHEESTVSTDDKTIHGARAIKFTSPGGAGNGGGFIETNDFTEITESKWLGIFWQLKSSVADVKNSVTIHFYDSTQSFISSTTIWSEDTNNPTTWTPFFGYALPPADARYMRLNLTGCDSADSTAGSTWFDDIRLITLDMQLKRRVEWTSAGAYKWTCPDETRFVVATVIGGGGSGGGVNGGQAAAGGGGGGHVFGIIPVSPGTIYDVTVGAGGAAAGTGNDGNPGGTSTFETLSATGGGGGLQGAGAAGGGGTATGGCIRESGDSGNTRTSTTIGGNGGDSVWFGTKSAGGNGATQPTPPYRYGAGGGGAGTASNTVAGADGAVILEF